MFFCDLVQIGDVAMQEQRGLVDQPLDRIGVFDDDRLGELFDPRRFAFRQILAGVDDDREFGKARFLLDLCRSVRYHSISGSIRSTIAQSNRSVFRCSSASSPVPTAVIVDILAGEQLVMLLCEAFRRLRRAAVF